MDLFLLFGLAVGIDLVVLRFVPKRKQVFRFACMSVLFAIETVLIIALVSSPLHPVYRPPDFDRKFWIQLSICVWWVQAARELVTFMQLLGALRKSPIHNKLLSNIIAASIYICAGLGMLGIVFRFPLQGVMATSGIIAIVLGLALQSTLSDVFSGISLNIERPFQIGDEILLEGGAEGKVIEVNWRSTHLRNDANDLIIIPNSAIAKMRIQNHSGGSQRYNGTLSIVVDSANEPEMVLEILKQVAMTCPAILDHPAPSVSVVDFKADRITYGINFSTASIAVSGDARSQLIAQLYKRARPAIRSGPVCSVVGQDALQPRPIFLFPENELFSHIPILEALADSEKSELGGKLTRQTFRPGEQILRQGTTMEAIQFIFSGVLEATHEVQDGRKVKVGRLGPGDSFGTMSLLTGKHTELVSLTSLTPGLLLGLCSKDLEPVLQSRPELAEMLSQSVSKRQQLIAMFDQAAVKPIEMSQPDLLSQIRRFFRISPAQN
jgi:small-conductance mechanosensitive channel/CRP-like cAMP-binding protein